MTVGLTGGIGAGKSTVARLIQSMGYPVYNADDRARKLQNEDAELLSEMVDLLGAEIISAGSLNRKLVAQLVFNDPNLLKKLNEIVHPRVQRDFDRWVGEQQASILFKESALLFETGANESLDFTVVVAAPEEIRIQRVVQRDGVEKEQVRSRTANQMAESQKVERADFVINNDDCCLLIPQAENLLEELINKSRV